MEKRACPAFSTKETQTEAYAFPILCFVVFALSAVGHLGYGIYCLWQNMSTGNTQKELQDMREEADTSAQF